MAKKDKNDSLIYRHLLKLDYTNVWDNYTTNSNINAVLARASKNGRGNQGIPDVIYVNDTQRIFIMAEVKPSISQHISQIGKEDPEKFAVDGIKHYLSYFKKAQLISDKLKEYFSAWKIVGLAISGNIEDDYNHRISTFLISDDNIEEQKGITNILNENDYINLFENIDEEKIIGEVSATSKKINKWLRSVDSQKRPILLSALMICLFDVKGIQNDFKTGYNGWSATTIIQNIPSTVNNILASEKIPTDKIELIKSELGFLSHDQDLNSSDILKDILNELRDFIIPLFTRKSNYDIIGKFYEEFLRYAGVANVKKGIVLTPRHITTLFTELVDIKVNDVFLDAACGTGAFLISAMNKLIETINSSQMPNKEQVISNLKNKQLIGFEKNATMYALAISNMMFRGDGKSHIFYCDYFTDQAEDELEKLKKENIVSTIGFINPPYGGKDNKDNPTKKEIQFLTRMLDNVSRYGVIIAPLSTYFKDDTIRNGILTKHTLKYVINMPKDLFMPNAATNTAIAVFQTNIPHGDKEVVFYDLKDDGFVLSKAKGRTDVFNKWQKIKSQFLTQLKNPDIYEDKQTLVKTKIKNDEEWVIQAHSKTNYERMNKNSFLNSIKDLLVYQAKRDLNLLDENINELTFAELLIDYYDINTNQIPEVSKETIDVSEWEECPLIEYFDMFTGNYYPATSYGDGDIPIVSASDRKNGIMTFSSLEATFEGNCLTIGKVGMTIYYQDRPFCMTCDVTALIPKYQFNKFIAMFIKTVLIQENYKWSYGRQIRLNDSQKLVCKFPIKKDNKGKKIKIDSINKRKKIFLPDWGYMEQYIKFLPYSDKI